MQKFSFHESQLIERNQASIENSFRSIKQESSIDQIRKRLQDNFLPTLRLVEQKFQPIKHIEF